MSEEEIIKYLENVIKTIQESDILFDEPANIKCGLKMEGAIQGLLDLYNKEKEDNKLYRLGMIQDQDFRDRLIEILGVGDNEETILQYIATLVSENARLEDIEDRKVQIEYKLVFNKGVKSVENKIRAKIEEYEQLAERNKDGKYWTDEAILYDRQAEALRELLEEE